MNRQNNIFYIFIMLLIVSCSNNKSEVIQSKEWTYEKMTLQHANELANMPLACIFQEYPNKTGHTASDAADILQTPRQLHPSFYGCFDWHSSVHGHWMLARLTNMYPQLDLRDSVNKVLSQSLSVANLTIELKYFEENILGSLFERTYGWAWLLKLHQELGTSTLPELKILNSNMNPLVDKIVLLWKDYLNQESYPNRSGVHNNTAFGLRLALDWARFNKDADFERQIKNKAIEYYGQDTNIPAHLEPNSSDFFSPSLYVADLMSQIYDSKEFNNWFNKYFDQKGIDNICQLPVVNNRNDYQIVHLDGLMFSRVVNIRTIIPLLSNQAWKEQLYNAQAQLLRTGLDNLSSSNYGGGHWLGSFATLALSGY